MALVDLYDDTTAPWGAPQPITYGEPDPNSNRPPAMSVAAPSVTAPPARTRTGNVRADWESLIQGLPPTASSIGQVFPQFSEWYPGSSWDRGDIKGPWGWADVIGNLSTGNGKWQWYTGSGGARTSVRGKSPLGSQFTDPLTKQYEALLKQQTGLYQQQQAALQQEAQRKEATRAQTEAAIKRLMDFMNQRVGTLQAPAYTGTEQEIIRSQYLDPIERDRTATQKRALENIGSRGFDPSSGIAQDLLRQVNQGFDQQRSQAQGDIAYRQILEQRSREQEAQQLLQALSRAPEAAARGDMDFLTYLDSLVNQPGQQALATSSMLADLPVQRTQLGMQALGLGGQPQSSLPGVLDLLQNAQYNRMFNQQNTADYWRNLGMSF